MVCVVVLGVLCVVCCWLVVVSCVLFVVCCLLGVNSCIRFFLRLFRGCFFVVC